MQALAVADKVYDTIFADNYFGMQHRNFFLFTSKLVKTLNKS